MEDADIQNSFKIDDLVQELLEYSSLWVSWVSAHLKRKVLTTFALDYLLKYANVANSLGREW